MKTRISAATYAFLTTLTRVVMRLTARVEVAHPERVPREGAIVLYANHLHLIDPPLVASSVRRRLRPMAKRELFETPLIGWVLWVYGAFPVRRYSADVGALRAGRNLLRNGDAVLVFPEGTRSRGTGLQRALPGAAMMALLGGAQVLPVAVTGTEQIKPLRMVWNRLRGRPIRIRVEFGEPFELKTGDAETSQAEQASDQMMRRLADLLPADYRGVYAVPPADTPDAASGVAEEEREPATLP